MDDVDDVDDVDETGPAIVDPADLRVPAGTKLDPRHLVDVTIRTNAAHAALGTELVGVARGEACIRLRFRPALAGEDPRRWANGVLTAMLDHVCSLTAVVALGDAARFGGTMGLRVEYGRPALDEPVLIGRARGEIEQNGLLRVHGTVHAPGTSDRPVASGRCTVVIAG